MKITIGIASTTHVDKHYEKMSKEALEDMAKQINKKYIPQLENHDFNKQIGVALYAEVFELHDGECALGHVSGIFENTRERDLYKIGDENKVWKKYKIFLDIEKLYKRNKNNKSKNITIEKDLNIADLLAIHLDSTKILPNGEVYKVKRFIASTGDLTIEVYPGDHDRHFHVISKQRKINARFDLDTLEFINNKTGVIRQNEIKKIINFFQDHPQILIKLKNEHKRLCEQN